MRWKMFCLYCHGAFTARNRRAKFCSVKHRVAYFRLRENLKQRQLDTESKAIKPAQSCGPIPLPDLTNRSQLEEYPEFKEYEPKERY